MQSLDTQSALSLARRAIVSRNATTDEKDDAAFILLGSNDPQDQELARRHIDGFCEGSLHRVTASFAAVFWVAVALCAIGLGAAFALAYTLVSLEIYHGN